MIDGLAVTKLTFDVHDRHAWLDELGSQYALLACYAVQCSLQLISNVTSLR